MDLCRCEGVNVVTFCRCCCFFFFVDGARHEFDFRPFIKRTTLATVGKEEMQQRRLMVLTEPVCVLRNAVL
jgi:hypothetical protein